MNYLLGPISQALLSRTLRNIVLRKIMKIMIIYVEAGKNKSTKLVD